MGEETRIGAVMVVGGGISGMQAALDLADSGFFVYLLEKTGAIGGAMPQYDKLFPSHDSSISIIAPKLVECDQHNNIVIMSLSEVVDIQGEEGNFTIRVKEHARYVDTEKCVACGICADSCPQKVDDEVMGGIAKRKAIFIKSPQAVPLSYQIDANACLWLNKPGKCGICAEICQAGAIHFEDKEREHCIHVGAVVMALGFQPFDPGSAKIWGYGDFPNVITSLQLECYLHPSGPTKGVVSRPSDGKPVKKMAFLQCVGSRDRNRCNNEYCSSICCMSAIKEAVIAKKNAPGLDVSIFFSDMRTHGKDFDRYYQKARDEYGIKFIRSRIHGVEPGDNKGKLRLHYVNDQGKQIEDYFDMVILSIGLETPDSMVRLANNIGIYMTPDRFASISAFMPVLTSKKGIFTCGAFNGPRDIPQSVIGGSAAAASVGCLLAGVRHTKTKPEAFRPEPTLDQMAIPRIGVFICHCGSNISDAIDVEQLAAFAQTLPDVAYVERYLFSCTTKTLKQMMATIEQNKLNRIVIAACNPRTHEPLFHHKLRASGINEHLIEMANIRNFGAWAHQESPDDATIKAQDQVRMAVARVSLGTPLQRLRVPVTKVALIIGAGLAGMTAALNLADQGIKVHLLEKTAQLGGNARHLFQTWSGEHVPRYLETLMDRVHSHPLIEVHCNTTVASSSGFIGNFTTTVKKNSSQRKETLVHGVTLVTTGGKRYIPTEFEYGKIRNVVTLTEFDKLHMHNETRIAHGKSFVFIQCVGSRNDERPYCSKVCCTHSVQAAIKLKKEVPERRIYILYREMRTYGQRERIYNQARELGIIFINFELYGNPIIKKGVTGAVVEVWDHILHQPLEIEADIVILASVILANPDAAEIAHHYNLQLNSDGFFEEAHAKLQPVEFDIKGVFVAGLAHYPKPLEESVSQSLAAAAKAAKILSQEELQLDAVTADVDPTLCDGCALCVDACPYRAIRLLESIDDQDKEKKSIQIDPFLCKGCGICQRTCPHQAVSIPGFTFDQIGAEIDGALVDSSKG